MLLALLALVSGAGLVAVALTSLLRSGERFRQQVELDANRDAQQVASALADRLRSAALLASDLPGERHVAAAGRLAAPSAVGWVEASVAPPPDPVVATRLELALRAEHQHADHAQAERVYDNLLGDQGPGGLAGLTACAAAAWHAHRAAREERAARLLGRLDAALATTGTDQLADPRVASALAATVMLHQARSRTVPAWADPLLVAMPEQPGTSLMAHLGDADRAMRHAEAVRLRARLQQVQEWVRMCARGPNLVAVPDGSRLLCWFPEAGVLLVEPAQLAVALAAAEPRARVVAGPDLPTDAHVVVPDALAVVARAVPVAGFFARPSGLALAVAGLGAVFLLSSLLAVRSLHRDALAVRTRAEFLTVVTHELKTPLASIRLLSEMLQEGRVPAGREAEYHRALAGEAARLSMLIENVLDLGRFNRGERSLDLRTEDACALTGEAVALFRPLAERDGIVVQVELTAHGCSVRADRNAMHQALLNVLDNARKYAAAGGRIEVVGAVHEERYRVEVRDHGPGVPPAERESVFERFRRGSAHRHGSVPGVGLGLYLARAIVRRHGGELHCTDPQSGPGAVFVFDLPLAPAGTGGMS
ncbi:MAG: hypothetical protein RL148_2808 [Planctomycetota bacterium]|jgi:two-component system phosphate regulon sensor histidine kinase PhoR